MTFIMFYSILNDYFAILCYVERYFAIYLRFSWKIFHSIVAVAVCTVQYSAVMLEASSICIFCFYSIETFVSGNKHKQMFVLFMTVRAQSHTHMNSSKHTNISACLDMCLRGHKTHLNACFSCG